MFGSSSAFGQSTANPFGSQSGFGQANNQANNPFAPKPFGSTNPFGSQSGSSIFGGTSTGVFGTTQPASPLSATPAFGASSTPSAFGASSTPAFGGSSVFGQKPAFGGFGSSTQSSPFGSTFQQSQPSFGSSVFGSSSPFSTSSQPAFGANTGLSFGSSSSPAFGTSSAFGAATTPAFGSTTSAFGSTGNAFGVSNAPVFGSGGAFGSSNTSVFGSPSTTPFGVSTTPSFGAPSTPAFGTSTSSAFGTASSAPAFGSTSTPFGVSSASSFSFGSSPSFGQSSSTFGSTSFGSTVAPPFGSQTTTNFAGGGFGQTALGGQNGGSRVASYTPTAEADTGGGTQPGKLESISAMNVYKDKSHEELRWEDYQRGDKGGPNAGQPSPAGFGVSTPQSSPFATSSTFGQSASNPFSTTTPANPFGVKPSAFGSTGFGTPSTSAFCSSAFGTSTPSNPFGQASAASPSLFSASSTAAFGSNTPSFFGTSGSSPSPSIFGSTSASGTTPSFASGLNFGNQSSSPFQSTTPSIGQTSGFGQTSLAFPSTTSSPFGQPSFSNPGGFGGGGLFSSSSSLTTNTNMFGQATPSFSTPLAQSTQASNSFSFGNFGQTQSGGLSGFGIGSNTFGQSVGQPSSTQNSAFVQQPVAVTNPFGVLPAMPQMSIGQAGASPSIQYGISSMPVMDKPAPVRISSLLTSRHFSQRRIRLPARKYHPKNDKLPFFTDDERTSSTPKADALFVPRENPRALIIRPMDQRPSISPSFMDSISSMHKNGKMFRGENGHIPNGTGKIADKENKVQNNDGSDHPCNNHDDPVKYRGASGQYQNGHSDADENQHQKGDSYITLTGHRAGEAAIVYEHGADIEAMMPKLRHSDYYTEPRVQELAAKERAEPGFCRRVKNFVVGRHGYGSIKFLGETDVRRLDLESLIQFNNREVIVYMDDHKKPPVGQGLNKPAEVTLLNIKCHNKKTGQQYTEGPRIEKYEEMLRKKAEDQGAEFLFYDPVKGEWKFKVDHF